MSQSSAFQRLGTDAPIAFFSTQSTDLPLPKTQTRLEVRQERLVMLHAVMGSPTGYRDGWLSLTWRRPTGAAGHRRAGS
jgi:hypothetical protein